MRLSERLRRLEERDSPAIGPSHEELERELWFQRMKFERMDALENADARHARDLVGLFRTQGILKGMDFSGLVQKVLAWRPLPEGGRNRNPVEREVSLAIYRGKPGTGHLACPDGWREAFEAGEELLARYEGTSDAELARLYSSLVACEDRGDEAGAEDWNRRLWEKVVGDSEGLLERVYGPSVEEVSDEERLRRVSEALAGAFYGEKHYRVWRLVQNRRWVKEEGAA